MVLHHLYVLYGVGSQVLADLFVFPVGEIQSLHIEITDLFPVVRDLPQIIDIDTRKFP